VSSTETSSSEDEDDTLAKPRHMLKPPKFDGQSLFKTFMAQFLNCAEKPPKFDGQSLFKTFMAQFLNCAENNKWNKAQKLAYLHNSLDKEAATYYGTMEKA